MQVGVILCILGLMLSAWGLYGANRHGDVFYALVALVGIGLLVIGAVVTLVYWVTG